MKKKDFDFCKYKVGDFVLVKAIAEPSCDKKWFDTQGYKVFRKIKSKKVKEPFEAQIVGVATFHEGEKIKGDWENPGFLNIKQVVHAWKVRRGLKNKSITVLQEDIKLLPFDKNRCLPKLFINQTWPEYSRKAMREYMEGWPRDKKGRWTKQQ